MGEPLSAAAAPLTFPFSSLPPSLTNAPHTPSPLSLRRRAFNSWDRMPFVTMVRDGVTPSSIPADNNFHHSFVVANYAADGGCLFVEMPPVMPTAIWRR